MNVQCGSCQTVYRVDPRKVPADGVRARCTVCAATIAVTQNGAGTEVARPRSAPREAAPAPETPAPAPPPAAPAAAPPPAPQAPPSPPRRVTQPFFQQRGSGGGGAPAAPPAPEPAPRPSAPVFRPTPGQPVTRAPAPPSPPERASRPSPAPAAAPEPAAAPAAKGGAPAEEKGHVNPFLARDPRQKARRLARALVSDMIVYQPEKRQQALAQGNLKEAFEEEIDKSWEEYVEQVGRELATSTPYWTDALNEILAGGQKIF